MLKNIKKSSLLDLKYEKRGKLSKRRVFSAWWFELHVSNISRTTLTIDVGRRGGDIVEHHRGGNIATEVVTR